jgi:hypothetical protein
MKYILTTGCSFTNNRRLNPDNVFEPAQHVHNSWPYYLQKKLGKEYKVMNYGVATNDNVSMCRIILYHLDRLIKENVNPKDITVIIQWSAAVRQSVYLHKTLDENSHGMGHTLVYHNNWNKTPGVFYLTGGFQPPTGPDSAIKFFNIENAIHYWQAEITWDNTVNTTMHWLETWLLLEKTCSELGIDAYYMSMRDIFSHMSGDNFLKPKPNTKENWMNDVEVLKPYLDKLPINSERYWHYKNYKGLLEWTIDNRNDNIPVFQEFQEPKVYTFDEYVKVSGHEWGHPSAEMMEIFVNTELCKLLKL